jgi:oligopeptide/dipeptide ABC transporter ATP-binding protein
MSGMPATQPQVALPDRPALLEVEDLGVKFTLGGGWLGAGKQVLQAVAGISLAIARGETLAVVGESGCGKTTLGRAVIGLYKPSAGRIRFRGETVDATRSRPMRRAVQMIFQDPYGSLNPRMPIGDVIAEPLKIHGMGSRAERRERARELIQLVGLPIDALNRYPHQFSGGQRQRIAIARALGPVPEIIIADEPLSALDVSIQSQILNLMGDLKDRNGLAYLFISHDLAAVHHIADRVAVMYLGRIVEIGTRDALFGRPSHPYTQALIAAIPRVGHGKRRRGRAIAGDVPSPIAPPPGCAFHPRCPKAQAICRTEAPILAGTPDGAAGHAAACHFAD